jgi:hypothetical protein
MDTVDFVVIGFSIVGLVYLIINTYKESSK